ncbi:MAG: transposase [Rhodoferax sp.]|nr:transposase [Rhodoferax sp.]
MIYHLLRSDHHRDRVLLVCFVQRPSKPTKKAKHQKKWTPLPLPVLIGLRRGKFEQGLLEGLIVRVDEQVELPTWFGDLTSSELLEYDFKRKGAKKSHADRIDQILSYIWPLVNNLDEVLSAEDPSTLINRHARSCRPPQNETRMRCWLYTYLCFGRSRWALHYPVHKIGVWDRMTKVGKKFGRQSLAKGAQHGYGSNDPEMIEKILDGYRRFAGPGEHMSKIFRQTLMKIFGCTVTTDRFGRKYFVHPSGEPFPTLGQFEYRVAQTFPLLERQYTKFGHARTRNRLAPSLGRFTESVGNLMERTEEDGYRPDQVAMGYESGSHLPPLIVVRTRCVTSGMLVGIGFSVGGERASAYRIAKFCEAIDKQKFCSLFGYTIESHQWPSIGISPHRIADRGPGSTAKAQSSTSQGRAAIDEMPPSWMGQSKAPIESSNPRSDNIEGEPTFIESQLTIPQLAIQEIARTVAANNSADVSQRLNNQAVVAGVMPTPIALWNYLNSLGRNNAIPITFDDAVRAFLMPIQVRVENDGVYYLDQRFDSPKLRDLTLLERASATHGFEVKAYMLDVCLRHIWIEAEGQLVEVDAMLQIFDGDEQLFISVVELEQIRRLRRESASGFRVHTQAARSEVHEDFEEQTGKPFDQGTRKTGRAKRRNVVSMDERRQVIDYLRAKGGKS